MKQPSNYPPGATDNEPEITGDPPRRQAPPKFQPGRPSWTDKPGAVVVQVYLCEPDPAKEGRHRHVKGNLVRYVNVTNAKVGEVAAAIEAALFGPPNDEED